MSSMKTHQCNLAVTVYICVVPFNLIGILIHLVMKTLGSISPKLSHVKHIERWRRNRWRNAVPFIHRFLILML